MGYIASNENRLYTGTETTYGEAASPGARRRIPAVRLTAKQTYDIPARRDKTGTRTFTGMPAGTRRLTEYDLRTYLTAWSDQTAEPGSGPLFSAALGGAPQIFAGGTVTGTSGGTRIQMQGAHGLTPGQAVSVAGEIRFVTTVPGANTIDINAPFSVAPPAGAAVTPTVTYRPARNLPSATIFDVWSPVDSVQRIIAGAGVNDLAILVNADYHEFNFSGPAASLLDSRTFQEGEAGLAEFPAEPDDDTFDSSVVPGHLGQVWIGVIPERIHTLTSARIRLRNNIDADVREFGAASLRGLAAGRREVTADFEMFATDDSAIQDLYTTASQSSAVRMMFQLGQQPGSLFGVYMKSVMAPVPEFDDRESRLLWKFNGCRAQGAGEDELIIAFG